MLANGLAGVTRHEQHLEIPALGGKLQRKLAAIHARHHDVGQQQINAFEEVLGKLNGFAGVCGGQDGVAPRFQDSGRELPDLGLIFDEQHGLGSDGKRRRGL